MNAAWFRYLAQIAPWLTLVLLIAMFAFLHDALAPVPAVSFELPDSGIADSAQAGLVALILPGDANGAQMEGSLVFFDDARYELADPSSMDEFASRLGVRADEMHSGTLTLLSDRRVPAGDVMKVMAIAKSKRLSRVQLAEKHD